MTFLDKSRASAVKLYARLGEPADYHDARGVVTTVDVIFEQDVEIVPDEFESGVSERANVLKVQSADAPHLQRGERFVIDDRVWTVKQFIGDDRIEKTVTVT